MHIEIDLEDFNFLFKMTRADIDVKALTKSGSRLETVSQVEVSAPTLEEFRSCVRIGGKVAEILHVYQATKLSGQYLLAQNIKYMLEEK